ncbi:Glycosyltransferase Family 2 protein [Glomus cerebriforme]|uniref:chitin synthase n=1 Tax=Glomus cerebriforme TaxID=658196 RepID=A0A397T6E4_9GLOM|nr:Glycosyltransferase Family 2 protein [Glomus cerebriforme]
MVPCYSEGHDSMKASFDSLVATHYPDQNKVFFIIADGNITGSGNNKSTPDILLDLIVPFDESENFNNVRAKSYLSIGDGTKRHNMAKVYIGYYQYENRNVPTMLVVKVGNLEERKYPKAGNRGKRDSQLVLMQLLQRAFNNGKMSPLEFDMFEKFRKLTKKTIDTYEFAMMVDADTIVKEDSISVMVNCMNNDPSVVGLCGETKILNKTESWVTMIQVFEYYLSHHLGKTFESVFANVTCLPGCFCMYRVFSHNYEGFRIPILVDENIMMNYSTNEVDTLHQKNLLLLGEDRYLTTLMLRAFPKRKLIYCPAAICETIAPTDFKVLLSQRRRWINGTVHNMFELIVTSELPGRFCFSMQFAVFLELIGTFTSPFAILYILTTLIGFIAGFPFQLSVIFAAISFSLQLFIAIFTSFNPILVLWFFIYLFSVPIWYLILPVYAFWNFDDFSWGATRKLNDDGTSYSDTIFDRFDPKSVPFKRWDQWIKIRGITK